MKLFEIRNTIITFNPLILLVVAYYILNDGLAFVVMLFLVLSLHELSHTVMASILAYKVEKIELHPFGFEARLSEEIKSAYDEFVIALSGPLFSVLTGLCCMAFKNFASAFVLEFAKMSLTLGILNILPAYPLDGGRILFAILFLKTDAKKAKKITVVIGFSVFVLLCVSAFIVRPFNPSLLIFALFIFIADIKEFKRLKTARIASLLRSRTTLRQGEYLPVKCIALNKNVTYGQAMKYIACNAYTIIIVLDDNMKEVACISQNKLLEEAALLEGKKDITALRE